MTIENLTSLVNALRAETRYAAITPETLSSLLQNIVYTMVDLDHSSSIQSVTSLNSAIQLLVEDVKLDNYKTTSDIPNCGIILLNIWRNLNNYVNINI